MALQINNNNNNPGHVIVPQPSLPDSLLTGSVFLLLSVSAMLRASQAAEDGGDERLEDHAEDDDQDEGQCIFHNLELIFFSLCFGPSGPGDAYIFLLSESESKLMKASRRRRILSYREEDCPSPLPAGLA